VRLTRPAPIVRVVSVIGKTAALAALLAAGVLVAAALAGGGNAADTITTTTETSTQVTTETTTEPTTVTATTTVEQTTTETVESTGTTETTDTTDTTAAAAANSGSGTPTWVWVLLGLFAVGLVVLAILLMRRGGPSELSSAERSRLLQAAVTSWAGQGWAIQTQTADSAVLWRGSEQVLVTVDSFGHVATRPLSGGP
jgi:hypothetical protein